MRRLHAGVSSTQRLGNGSWEKTEDGKENPKKIKEARNRSHDGEKCIYRQGDIAGRVLTQEAGSSIPDISIQSKASHQSPQRVTSSVSSPEKLRLQSECRSSRTSSHSLLPPASNRQSFTSSLISTIQVTSNSPQYRQKNKVNVRNKNIPSSSTNHISGKEVIHDKVPKQQEENYAKCEDTTCIPNQHRNRQIGDRKTVTVSSLNKQDCSGTVYSPSVHQKRIKTVPFHYMQGSLNKAGSWPTILSQSSSRIQQFVPQSVTRPRRTTVVSSRQTKEKQEAASRTGLKTKKPSSEVITVTKNTPVTKCTKDVPSVTIAMEEIQQNVPDSLLKIVVGDKSSQHEFTEVLTCEQKMSAPTLDQTDHAYQACDTSSTHSFTDIVVNVINPNVPLVSTSSEESQAINDNSLASEHTASAVHNKQNISALEISECLTDVETTRDLQVVCLNSKAKSIIHELESEAVGRNQGLWQKVESQPKKNDIDQLEADVTSWKRMNLLDNILGKAELNVESLAFLIPQLEEDCSQVSSPLYAELHNFTTGDVCKLQKSKEEKDLYDEKLEKALRESEQLLAELSLLKQ